LKYLESHKRRLLPFIIVFQAEFAIAICIIVTLSN